MMQMKDNYTYYYDNKFDDLLIRLNYDVPVYSDEVYNNIYIIKSEIDDSVIGSQILYYKKRSKKVLEQYLPSYIFDALQSLNI